MHIDWQQVTALTIVAAAGLGVGRRIWGQIAAFGSKPRKSSGGCDSCPSSGPANSAAAAPTPLLQIQTRPPAHLRRPPSK